MSMLDDDEERMGMRRDESKEFDDEDSVAFASLMTLSTFVVVV